MGVKGLGEEKPAKPPDLHYTRGYKISGAFLVAQTVKNPPAVWETWVLSVGWEDPLEKGTATHSSIPAWRISWTEEPGGLQSIGLQKSQT